MPVSTKFLQHRKLELLLTQRNAQIASFLIELKTSKYENAAKVKLVFSNSVFKHYGTTEIEQIVAKCLSLDLKQTNVVIKKEVSKNEENKNQNDTNYRHDSHMTGNIFKYDKKGHMKDNSIRNAGLSKLSNHNDWIGDDYDDFDALMPYSSSKNGKNDNDVGK